MKILNWVFLGLNVVMVLVNIQAGHAETAALSGFGVGIMMTVVMDQSLKG